MAKRPAQKRVVKKTPTKRKRVQKSKRIAAPKRRPAKKAAKKTAKKTAGKMIRSNAPVPPSSPSVVLAPEIVITTTTIAVIESVSTKRSVTPPCQCRQPSGKTSWECMRLTPGGQWKRCPGAVPFGTKEQCEAHCKGDR